MLKKCSSEGINHNKTNHNKAACIFCTWWRHQMETFSVSLALCEGNPPVTDGLSSQWPVTRTFDVFFDMRLNKRLSKQSRRPWFETPSHSLWRHCNLEHAVCAPSQGRKLVYAVMAIWYRRLRHQNVTSATTCIIEVLTQKTRKYKYIHIFPERNSTRRGLMRYLSMQTLVFSLPPIATIDIRGIGTHFTKVSWAYGSSLVTYILL